MRVSVRLIIVLVALGLLFPGFKKTAESDAKWRKAQTKAETSRVSSREAELASNAESAEAIARLSTANALVTGQALVEGLTPVGIVNAVGEAPRPAPDGWLVATEAGFTAIVKGGVATSIRQARSAEAIKDYKIAFDKRLSVVNQALLSPTSTPTPTPTITP